MHGKIISAGVQSIESRKHFAFVFNLHGLPQNRAARDVLNRTLHQAALPAKFGLHAQDFAGITFANLLLQLPVEFPSKNYACHAAIIN